MSELLYIYIYIPTNSSGVCSGPKTVQVQPKSTESEYHHFSCSWIQSSVSGRFVCLVCVPAAEDDLMQALSEERSDYKPIILF